MSETSNLDFFKAKKGHAEALQNSSVELLEKLNPPAAQRFYETVSKRHTALDTKDYTTELIMVGKILQLAVPETAAVSDAEEEERPLLLVQDRDQLGQWDAPFVLKLQRGIKMRKEVRVEETTRKLRQVRKHAINLRALAGAGKFVWMTLKKEGRASASAYYPYN
jgi:hypothetical protein